MATFGYAQAYKPPRQASLALAAAGHGVTSVNDPFGLSSGSASSAFAPPAAPRTPAGGAGTTVKFNVNAPAQPTATPNPGGLSQPPSQTPSAAAVNTYDINTDPALQQIQALTGLNDDQARASATQQIRDALLAFGDPNLAGKGALGGDSTLAQAASQNPTSTVAQLGQQRDRNLKTLEDQLNAQNLTYGGYRVSQEQQAAQDYQNALAQAAAAVNSSIGQIQGGLNAALQSNAQQRAQAMFQAEALAAQYAMQNGINPGATSGGADTGGGGDTSGDTPPPQGSRNLAPASAYASSDPTLLLNLARAAAGRGLQTY